MAAPTPSIRQAVLCERVTFNTRDGYSLHRPRVDFVVGPDEPTPYRPAELCLFIQVSGSYGPQRFRVQLLDVTDPTQPPPTVYQTPERVIDLGRPMGPYRRRTRSWSVKLGLLPFPRPGWYELWVVFDGLPQARITILMEVAP